MGVNQRPKPDAILTRIVVGVCISAPLVVWDHRGVFMSLGVVDSIHVWHYCDWLETQPKQASHFIPLGILRDKECRRDILFHTPGTEWGWRPRKGWRDLLIERGQVPVEFLTRPGDEELAESLSRMVGGGPVQREMRPSGHTIDDLPIGIPPGYDIFGNVR